MRLIAVVAACCLMVSGCSDEGARAHPTADPSRSDVPGVRISQPQVPSGVPVAPDSDRVDLMVPRFSRPTVVDNPLFPVSSQKAVVFVGHVDGEPLPLRS